MTAHAHKKPEAQANALDQFTQILYGRNATPKECAGTVGDVIKLAGETINKLQTEASKRARIYAHLSGG